MDLVRRDLVLVGGGHAHVHVLKSFGMAPEPGVRITLIARDVETPYSGMLPGRLAGLYGHDAMHIDLDRLCRFAGARLVHAEAAGLDRDRREVVLPGRPGLRYDLLSLDIGSTPRATVQGAAEHALPLKPIAGLDERWDGLLAQARWSTRPLRLVVVGGGAAGAEVALAADHRLRALLPDGLSPQVTLLSAGRLLRGHAAGAARRLRRILLRRGVSLHEDTEVIAVAAGAVAAATGVRFPFDALLWATQAGAAEWLPDTGLALSDDGFVAVDASLRSLNDPYVFAAGDVATMVDHPRPKAGVVAVRQGPPLAENLRRALRGELPRPFRPQRRMLALIGTADGRAVASWGSFSAQGAWLWRLKDAIDRRWMRRYQDLPAMTPSAPKSEPMRCAGCGGKVGAHVLRRALARVGVPDAPEDAAPLPEAAAGERLVQSVDQFRAPVSDPWLAGRLAAVHALGDIHAMGGRPLAALAVVGVPPGEDAVVENDVAQVLAGALDALDATGCRLAGGHTLEAEALTVGFTITGAVPRDAAFGKDKLRPGDWLVLTRPLGSGALFAAAMRGAGRGRWLAGAVAAMGTSLGEPARLLAQAGARGCTDVTGFGLLGHLMEMAEASGVDAVVDPSAVPVLPGALEVLESGVRSSLAPANAQVLAGVSGFDPGNVRHALLLDPQTAGGLLAGVPAERAARVVADMRAAGHRAAIVGRVTARAGAAPHVAVAEKMAEADGNRTHRSPVRRAAGFEDQGGHQTPFTSGSAPPPWS